MHEWDGCSLAVRGGRFQVEQFKQSSQAIGERRGLLSAIHDAAHGRGANFFRMRATSSSEVNLPAFALVKPASILATCHAFREDSAMQTGSGTESI